MCRQRPHPRLNEQPPTAVHGQLRPLPVSLQPAEGKRPLYAGRVHFTRQVNAEHTISVLNVAREVSTAMPGQGVWATLDLRPTEAKPWVFDAAPDAEQRTCLAAYNFPLSEPVLPHPAPAGNEPLSPDDDLGGTMS